MEIIIGLIIAFILLAFLYGILCLIIKKWPVLIWIVGIGGGVILAIITSWWIGAIGGFILIGFLAAAEASGGHKCAHCGSYDTYLQTVVTQYFVNNKSEIRS